MDSEQEDWTALDAFRVKNESFKKKVDETWFSFYKAVDKAPSRPWTLKGLDIYDSLSEKPEETVAVDFGCGVGNDTIAFLSRGWKVLAVDSQEKAFAYLKKRIPKKFDDRLQIQRASFEEVELPPSHLISASYSLPFAGPKYFDVVWSNITKAIVPKGMFMGQFFGKCDEWCGKVPGISFHAENEVHAMFADAFKILVFEEKKYDGMMAIGRPKRWHVYSVYAQKLKVRGKCDF